MKKTKNKELEVVYSKQVKAKMAGDPEIAAMVKEMAANFRQAMWAVGEGHYNSFDDAIEAITGSRPRKLDDPFDDEEEDKPADKN